MLAYKDPTLWFLREAHIKPLLDTLIPKAIQPALLNASGIHQPFLPACKILESFSRTLLGLKPHFTLNSISDQLRSNVNFLSSILIHGEVVNPPALAPPHLFEPLIISEGCKKYLHHPSLLWVDSGTLSQELDPILKKRLTVTPEVLVYEWLLDLEQNFGDFLIPESFITELVEDFRQCGCLFQSANNSLTHQDVFEALKPVAFHACNLIKQRPVVDWTVELGGLFKPFRKLDIEVENGVFLYQLWGKCTWTGSPLLMNNIQSLIASLLGKWDMHICPFNLKNSAACELAQVISPKHVSHLHKHWKEFFCDNFSFDLHDGGKFVRLGLALGVQQNKEISFYHHAIQYVHQGTAANVQALLAFKCDPEVMDRNHMTPLCKITRQLLDPNTGVTHQGNLADTWCVLVGGGAGRLTPLDDLVKIYGYISGKFVKKLPDGLKTAFVQLSDVNSGFWWHMHRCALFTTNSAEGYHSAQTIQGIVGVKDVDHKLFSVDGIFNPIHRNKSENDNSGIDGRRLVGFHTVDGAQFCFKKDPELPGIEFAIQQFMFMLFGSGTPWSELIQMEKSGDLYLVSQFINGVRFDKAINFPLMMKLHPQRTSELIISSILTNPEDGRPQNYVIASDGTNSFYLVCVDNDHSLGSAVARSVSAGFSKQLVQGHCVLFCLPEMDDVVDPSVRHRLINLKCGDFLRDWLGELKKQHEFHQKLMGSSDFPIKEIGMRGSFLGIPLTYHILERLSEKLLKTVNILTENPSTTHRNLLDTHEPSSGHQYQLPKNNKSLQGRFDDTDGRAASSVTAQGYIDALDTPFESMDQAYKALKEILNPKSSAPGLKLSEMKTIRDQQECVAKLDFQKPNENERVWLDELSKLSTLCEWKVMKLIGTNLLDQNVLRTWHLCNLTYIDVSNSSNLDGNDLIFMVSVCPMLCILKAVNLSNLEEFIGDHTPLLKLTKLDLSSNQKLSNIEIDTPYLEKLYVSYCPKLCVIHIDSAFFKKFKSVGTPSFELKDISSYQQLHISHWLKSFIDGCCSSHFRNEAPSTILNIAEELASAVQYKFSNFDVPPQYEGLLRKQIELSLKHCDQHCLRFGYSKISDSLIIAISEALKVNTSLTQFTLICKGEDMACIAMSEALKVNTTLTLLQLNLSRIKEAGALSIGVALKANTTLIELDLSLNEFGEPGATSVSEALKVNTTLTKLDICLNYIGEPGVIAISEALKVNTTLTKLDIGRNRDITEPGATAISEALKVNTTLTVLHINMIKIGDPEATSICEALKVNTTLTKLNISWNNIGELGGGTAIGEALKVNTTLTELDISNNKIGELGAVAISEALKVNTTLTELDTSWNEIGELGAVAISEALKVNTTLTELDIMCNRIGELGAVVISEALKVNTTLSKLLIGWNRIGELAISEATLTKFHLMRVPWAIAISEVLKVNIALTELDISNSEIGDSEALAISKALKGNITLTVLCVGINKIGDSGATAISEALKINTTLTKLSISENKIREQGATAISEALKINTTLTELHIDSNKIGDPGAIAISKALKFNTTLTKLDISSNDIEEPGVAALTTNTTLSELILEKNIDDMVGDELPFNHFLPHQSTPKNLIVRKNQLILEAHDKNEGHWWKAMLIPQYFLSPSSHCFEFHTILSIQGNNSLVLDFLLHMENHVKQSLSPSILDCFNQIIGSAAGGMYSLALSVPHIKSTVVQLSHLSHLVNGANLSTYLSDILSRPHPLHLADITRPLTVYFLDRLTHCIVSHSRDDARTYFSAEKNPTIFDTIRHLLNHESHDPSVDVLRDVPSEKPVFLLALGVSSNSPDVHKKLTAQQSSNFIYVRPDLTDEEGMKRKAVEVASFLIQNVEMGKLPAAPNRIMFKCRLHGPTTHDFFISYRVSADSYLAKELAYNLNLYVRPGKRQYTAFLDSMCLPDGEDWRDNFLNGLKGSKVIVLLISNESLKGMQIAHQKPDNMLLEFEYALKRLDTEGSSEVIVIPVWVGSKIPGSGAVRDSYTKFERPKLTEFPDEPHIHHLSSKKKIREVMGRIYELQGFHDVYTPDLAGIVSYPS